MNPFRAWTRPVAMIEQTVGLVALGSLWYWWLGIAESTTLRLLLSATVLLAMLAALWLLVQRGRARVAGSAGPALVALLLFAMSLAAAYFLIWWVPAISGLRGQTVSMVIRFGTAFALVITFWANLLGSMARSVPSLSKE